MDMDTDKNGRQIGAALRNGSHRANTPHEKQVTHGAQQPPTATLGILPVHCPAAYRQTPEINQSITKTSLVNDGSSPRRERGATSSSFQSPHCITAAAKEAGLSALQPIGDLPGPGAATASTAVTELLTDTGHPVPSRHRRKHGATSPEPASREVGGGLTHGTAERPLLRSCRVRSAGLDTERSGRPGAAGSEVGWESDGRRSGPTRRRRSHAQSERALSAAAAAASPLPSGHCLTVRPGWEAPAGTAPAESQATTSRAPPDQTS